MVFLPWQEKTPHVTQWGILLYFEGFSSEYRPFCFLFKAKNVTVLLSDLLHLTLSNRVPTKIDFQNPNFQSLLHGRDTLSNRPYSI